MSKIKRALGLMSGTSMDGIDLALIETDGESHVRRLAAASVEYPEDFRHRLRTALAEARAITRREERPGTLAAVERDLTERHAEAALRFLGDRMLQPSAVDVIGFHGQTVLHRPDQGTTVQLGDGPLLARCMGIDVVYDLRAADVEKGGEGAPLVPVYHRALAAKVPARPVAFLNIGGVANVTWIGSDETLVAFDTGPGNALIDDWMRARAGRPRDDDGSLAARGKVDERVLHAFLLHPFFAKPVPKSLDRNAFPLELADGLAVAEGAATLTALTAEAVARAREHMPAEPALWVVCGGGRRNRTLMGMLAARVENALVPAEALGLDGDTLEAQAWAYLAVRSLAGLPITFPGTTGAATPATGGVLARAP
ncbi:MAG: anhydro-N-acetylmuramic acid kinase [Hyphomicrobiaceae bacterium]|nr:anhydro-N-acetylmuramic acid kinase [Hyphomicrobiaceae bacterium]